MPPSSATTLPTSRSRSEVSATSAFTTSAWLPRGIERAVSCSVDSSRPASAKWAPASASSFAIAAPMPRLAPVTTATLPCNPSSMLESLSVATIRVMATTVKTGRTVGQTIEAAAERWPDRIGVDFGTAAYTYRDLWARARRTAAAFAAQGVKPGEAVLVMLDNTIEFVDAWLGLALIGAIQVPVNTEYVGEAMQLAEGDVYFAPLPLFHIAGQWALVYACFQVGATAIVRRRFSAGEFWSTVRESGARVSFLLGAMANFLARQEPKADDVDNPMERMLVVPLINDVDDFRRRFGVRVCTCYGSTEVNVPLISDYEVTEPGIAGRPVAGFDIRIVDEHDRDVPVGAVGELVVRSSEPWLLATEYHRNPEASLRLFRNLWLHTGDAFRKDAHENYFFVDRIKDYIRRRGENISSFEVEREVNAHPAVLECAAMAVKSASTEDDLKVVVVLKSGMTLEPEELREFLRGRVPRFMVPNIVEVIAELPKTPTGKIQKHLLRGR